MTDPTTLDATGYDIHPVFNDSDEGFIAYDVYTKQGILAARLFDHDLYHLIVSLGAWRSYPIKESDNG